MKQSKNCIICNSEFSTHKDSKYCSTGCYRVAQRAGAYKKDPAFSKRAGNCVQCGSIVARNFSTKRNGEKSDKLFCSRACYNQNRTERRSSCLKCGVRVSIISQKYCSHECRVSHKKPKPVNCLNCKTLFTPVKPINRKNGVQIVAHSSGKTCSHECHMAWISNNEDRKKKISKAFTKEKHPNWQGGSHNFSFRGHDWEKISEKIRKKAGYKCEICGMSQNEHIKNGISALM